MCVCVSVCPLLTLWVWRPTRWRLWHMIKLALVIIKRTSGGCFTVSKGLVNPALPRQKWQRRERRWNECGWESPFQTVTWGPGDLDQHPAGSSIWWGPWLSSGLWVPFKPRLAQGHWSHLRFFISLFLYVFYTRSFSSCVPSLRSHLSQTIHPSASPELI